MLNVCLEVIDLTVKYGDALAVDNVSFTLNDETIVFFGQSGCGKTSILKAILGVREPGMKIIGKILFNGKPINKGSGDVGITFQGPVIPTWMTVLDLCRLGCYIRVLDRFEQEKRIMDMLTRFDIDNLADKYPKDMSGGEKQRCALAITLLNQPKILLLDEPTTFIDGITRINIWNYLEKVVRPMGIPTIIVSHDPNEALTLGDQILILSKPSRIVKRILVPFPHPRTEEVLKTETYWKIKKEIAENSIQL